MATSYISSNTKKLFTKYGNYKSSYVDSSLLPHIEAELTGRVGYYSSSYRGEFVRSYNRMQFSCPSFAIPNTRQYLFFTKPELNILCNSKGVASTSTLNPVLAKDGFWVEMKSRYRRVISQLQGTARRRSGSGAITDKHPFTPLLTNFVAGSLDLPTKSADTTETAQTIYGSKIEYRKSSMRSDEGYDFSLEFTDNPWLDVYHYFRIWDEYEYLKDLGVIKPPGGDSNNKYRLYKMLHDQIAIYKFIVSGDDMETIIHYSKLTGCFPKSVPREAFGELKEGMISYSVDWHAQFVEDMNPLILYEFNEVCKKFLGGKAPSRYGQFVPVYNDKNKYINSGFIKCPYVIKENDSYPSTGSIYKLKWLNKL